MSSDKEEGPSAPTAPRKARRTAKRDAKTGPEADGAEVAHRRKPAKKAAHVATPLKHESGDADADTRGEGGLDEEERAERNTAANPPPSKVLRGVFYALWVITLPLAFAIATVWLFTPAPDAVDVSALRVLVSEQKIPFGIVFFTAFAILIWRFRYDLPLAQEAGIAGRVGVPPKLRGRVEEAMVLVEEARRIMKSKRRAIERELTPSERDDVHDALADLEDAMNAEPFVVKTFERAHGRADRIVGEHLGRWRKGEIREYAESIAIAIAVAMVLRMFAFEAFKIPSGSMIPTLMVGDHIFVNKLSYGPVLPFSESRIFADMPPKRGDVMVFKYPEKPEQDFIKRVIALPGDTFEVVDGRPILNGWIVPQCKVGPFEHDGRTGDLYIEYLEDKAFMTLFDVPPPEKTCESSRDCDGDGTCYAGLCGTDYKSFHVSPNEVWVMGDNRNNSHDSRSWYNGRGGGVPFENIKGRAMFVFATFGPGTSWKDRMLVNVMGRPRIPESQARLQPALDKCLREVPSVTSPPPPSG